MYDRIHSMLERLFGRPDSGSDQTDPSEHLIAGETLDARAGLYGVERDEGEDDAGYRRRAFVEAIVGEEDYVGAFEFLSGVKHDGWSTEDPGSREIMQQMIGLKQEAVFGGGFTESDTLYLGEYFDEHLPSEGPSSAGPES